MNNKSLPLKQKTYEYIKNKILTCELKPGSDISEEKLAMELGISRTPVREAIMRLGQENLVNIYPRKGSFVSEITLKDIQEVLQIREIVETQVAVLVCKSIDKEKLLYFRQEFEKFDTEERYNSYEDFFELDIAFHKFIVSSNGNQNLVEIMDKVYDKDYRIRVLTTNMFKTERLRNREEHLNIIDAFLEEDVEKVEEYLSEHIQKAKYRALKLI
ncbi:GntR family transcriptional regulator [Vallitalea longa]|uniref:GntR family transcriptional regulator n=1 Tax=Vallitalea longa TaxID=2936439 RepID=A0A9W6DDW8_9FIRM|nr:GntR family transcriptional regulator [Vallitalea longa]GKX27737.1 GntR family transcriptional regulator [Vallitalea longa]